MVVRVPIERQDAKANYPAGLLPVGDHANDSVDTTVVTVARPDNATHITLQALDVNIRYMISGGIPTSTNGFQLAAGAITLIAFAQGELRVVSETTGSTIQYQWLR